MATDYSTLITLSKTLPIEGLRELFEEIVLDLQDTENDTRTATKDFLVNDETLTEEEFNRLSLTEINERVVKEMQDTIDDLATAESQVGSLQQNITEAQNKIDDLNDQLEASQRETETLGDANVALQKRVDDLQSQNSEYVSRIQALETELEERDDDLQDLQTVIEAKNRSLATAWEENSSLKTSNATLAQKVEALTEDSVSLASQLRAASSEIGGYKNAIKEKDELNQVLQSQVDGLVAERQQWQAALDAEKTKSSRLAEQKLAAEQGLVSAKVELSHASERIATLQDSLQIQENKVVSLSREVDLLKRQLEDSSDESLRQRIIDLEERNANLESDLEEFQDVEDHYLNEIKSMEKSNRKKLLIAGVAIGILAVVGFWS